MATGTSMSSYLEAALLNWIKGTAFPGVNATLYVALYTATPNDTTGSGAEVTGNGYARASIASTGWSAITDGGAGVGASITNSVAITFATPTGSGWGTVVAFALYDASSGGNEILWASLSSSKVINGGDLVQFQASQLSVAFD